MIWWTLAMWAIGRATGAALGFRKGSEWERKRMFPNQWKCPIDGCDGEGGSNNPATLIRLIEIHNEAKHP